MVSNKPYEKGKGERLRTIGRYGEVEKWRSKGLHLIPMARVATAN